MTGRLGLAMTKAGAPRYNGKDSNFSFFLWYYFKISRGIMGKMGGRSRHSERKNSMALVIDLKPGEKILIGDAVITNGTQRARLHIAGDSPILREKDVLREEDADTPCKRIYFIIQCMYLARNPRQYHEKYFESVREVQHASPSCAFFFMQINEHIISGSYYKALKTGRELIEHEKELLKNATKQAAR
jgi:flagellar protein FlbT